MTMDDYGWYGRRADRWAQEDALAALQCITDAAVAEHLSARRTPTPRHAMARALDAIGLGCTAEPRRAA